MRRGLLLFIFLLTSASLFSKINEEKDGIFVEGLSHFFMGHYQYNKNDALSALNFYQKAYKDFRKVNDSTYVLYTGIKIASILYSEREYERAILLTDSLNNIVSDFRPERALFLPNIKFKIALIRFHIFCEKGSLDKASHELDVISSYHDFDANFLFSFNKELARYRYYKYSSNIDSASHALLNLVELCLNNNDYRSLSLCFREVESIKTEGLDSLFRSFNIILHDPAFQNKVLGNNILLESLPMSVINTAIETSDEFAGFDNENYDNVNIYNKYSSLLILIVIFALVGFLIIILKSRFKLAKPLLVEDVVPAGVASVVESVSAVDSNEIVGSEYFVDTNRQGEIAENNGLSDSNSKELFDKIDNIMRVQQPFLNPNLRRKDIAKLANTNETYIYISIRNNSILKNFSDYINSFRVEKACELLLSKERMSMEEIAMQCGFTGRTSFYRAFTLLKHTTPNEYRKDNM